MRLDYRIVFDQPWRIGSGRSAGRFVDRLVRRDGRGLPVVPGTTLRGLVADALCELAPAFGEALCSGTAAEGLCGIDLPGRCPRCALTGSPRRPGAVGWGPARLVLARGGRPLERSAERQAAAVAAVAVPGLLARPRPRTSIDRVSGRAAEEKLFSLEEAHPGLTLAGRLDLAPALSAREVALLVAALRWVRRVGGGRRRGLGGCRIEIDVAALAPHFAGWREAVESLAAEGKGGAEPEAPTAAEAGDGEAEGPAGAAVQLSGDADTMPAAATAAGGDATVIEPVTPPASGPTAATPSLDLGGATALLIEAEVVGEVALGAGPDSGNLVPGLDHVPGSTLRGAFAARWRGGPDDPVFARSFLSGRVRFGFLYPPGGVGETALPLPLAVHTCKQHPGPEGQLGHGFFDRLLEPAAERCHCGARLVPWGPGFGAADRLERPELAVSPHNRIEPETQTTAEAALFAYQTLAEGERLRGFVRADHAEDLAALLAGVDLAPGARFRLRVGRRKGALGWLDCTLRPFDGTDGGVGLFPDARRLPAARELPAAVRVDLLTPALLRDRHLRHREALAPADLGLSRGSFDRAVAGTTRIAGWNLAHGLPKADELAIAAGSSYLLEGVAPEELPALRRAALAGVGRRRAEGFGALAVSLAEEPR